MKVTLSIIFKHYEFEDLKIQSFTVQTSSLINMVTQLYDIPRFQEFIRTGYFVKSLELGSYECSSY